MFTGIVETTGKVRSAREVAGGRRIAVDISGLAQAPGSGDSVAVNGVCLTVVNPAGQQCEFDVITESLDIGLFHRIEM